MATYGYAGDFSSDDDEKVEQVQIPARFDDTVRPSKSQIEEAIETIKRLPYDQEVSLTDDVLAGLLDYYKTQRGPIVDSTRKLYNKIALRLVREDQSTDGAAKELNGNNNNNNNNNINNSNNVNLANTASQQTAADAFSSDDDDIETTGRVIKNEAKKFDSRVVHQVVEDEEMELDLDEAESPPYAAGKFEKLRPDKYREDGASTTSDDDDDDDDDSSQTSEDANSESDVLEVTPIKPPQSANREKEAIEVLMAMRPSTPKQTESTSLKRQPLAQSTPKESNTGTAKKPYTRSQRVTRSTTRFGRNMQKIDGKDTSSSSADVFIEKKQVPSRRYAPVVAALIVLVLGFLAYHFRSNILNTAEPMFRKKITF